MGNTTPASGLLSAVGYAASIILNKSHDHVLALPGFSFVKGNASYIVVNNGGNEEELTAALGGSGASLYGKHYNLLTPTSLSTFYRGSLGNKTSSSSSGKDENKKDNNSSENQFKSVGLPRILSGNASTHLHVPDNQTFPVKKIIFVDSKSSAASSKMSCEEAVKAILNCSESEKEIFCKGLIEKIEGGVHQVNHVKEISKLFD
jgi:hypothetical protein